VSRFRFTLLSSDGLLKLWTGLLRLRTVPLAGVETALAKSGADEIAEHGGGSDAGDSFVRPDHRLYAEEHRGLVKTGAPLTPPGTLALMNQTCRSLAGDCEVPAAAWEETPPQRTPTASAGIFEREPASKTGKLTGSVERPAVITGCSAWSKAASDSESRTRKGMSRNL
jgi:hypothetical protein